VFHLGEHVAHTTRKGGFYGDKLQLAARPKAVLGAAPRVQRKLGSWTSAAVRRTTRGDGS
jgi:hypothetical protein